MLKIEERGKELKVPHHASTAAAHDGNLPQLALYNSQLPLFLIIMLKSIEEKYMTFLIPSYKYFIIAVLQLKCQRNNTI